MAAMIKIGPIRSTDDPRILHRCCHSWSIAHTMGTDSEEYGSLIGPDSGATYAYGMSDPIRFCPWCGSPKEAV